MIKARTKFLKKSFFTYGFLFVSVMALYWWHLLSKEEAAAKECWQSQSKPIPQNISSHSIRQKNLIPSSIPEAPNGTAAAIPKSFLIEERDFCRKRPRLKVIAYVHSAIKSVKKRQITRFSWGRASEFLGTVFMVGMSKNKEEEKIIRNESKLYGDIVQGNYTDVYQLLVYKALNALYWINKNCKMATWVVHSDDDNLIDVYKLVSTLNEFEDMGRNNEIFCHTFPHSKVYRRTKWSLSHKEYPCEYFPPYCAGPMWVTNMNAIPKLLNTVPNIRYLWIDDVYLTGFVAEFSHIPRTSFPSNLEQFEASEIGSVIAWSNLNSTNEDRIGFWKQILKYYKSEPNAKLLDL